MHAAAINRDDLSLGLLAGGAATRLGGLDKAWMTVRGQPQVLRWQRQFLGEVAECLVSANTGLARYAEAGLTAYPDAQAGAGPIAGLAVLAARCRTPWLFTFAVDVEEMPVAVLHALVAQAGRQGATLVDAEGAQPLVSLWRCEALRPAAERALQERRLAVQALCAELQLHRVQLPQLRLGNINTREQLRSARAQTP